MSQSECQGVVLVVDDDPAVRQTLAELLGDEGYIVRSAANGREALVELQRTGEPRPCVILLDLMMPFMNGHELYAELKATPSLADIPVVVLSADPDLRRVARPFGGEFLAKPIRIEVVLAAIERHCGSP